MTTTNDMTEADRALKAKHRAMWALGDYPAVARDIVGDLGPVLVQASGVGPGERVLDVAAGSGNASIPAAAAGASVVASDLTPELFDDRPQGRRRSRRRDRLAAGRRRGAALPGRVLRHGPVLRRGHVRPAPPGRRRRAGPGPASGRHPRPAQLDAGGLHRADVRDHEAVRAAAPARCAAAAAVGQRGARPGAARRPGHRGLGVAGVPRRRRVRDAGRRSATTSRPTTARPSRSTRSIADDPEKVAALDRELEELAARFDRGDGSTVLDWEYLLLTCERTA